MSPRKNDSAAKNGPAARTFPGDEPIAIIGIGCRYPGLSGPAELWDALMAGREVVGPYPGGRFPELDRIYDQAGRDLHNGLLTNRGGFLDNVADFDAQFFELSPRESVYIDPQHRLLLEVAWEALEDAGQVKENCEGSATGVYTGLWTSEYENRLYESSTEYDFYSVTGCGRASASGRLSFTFGLQGPSVTVDTACSSSLVAVQMACEALRCGQIDMALAGGANLILGPEITELFTKAKMLSPDGRCKFADASADGFVRSEGAGMVVLKRLARAVADKDPIYAVIRGGAVNNDGRTSGLLVTPSRAGQKEMLRAAWKSAAIAPNDLHFIEMHGTGTSVGDPVEIESVGGALAETGTTRVCMLGSVKTNLGHTESASGVTGVIKAALAVQHRMIPPSLHFTTPNPKIAWDGLPVRVAARPVDLSQENGPILAGVNSFGLSGTNVHVVLQEMEPQPEVREQPPGPYILPLSARTPESLDALLNSHLRWIQDAGRSYPVRDVCYTAAVRRNHHEYRTAIVGEDRDDLAANLSAAIRREDSAGVVSGRAAVGPHKIVFICPGQGSQWLGMARELFDRDPVFRHAFEQCDHAIAAETGWRLSDRVLGPEAERYLTQIDVIQPSLFAMSIALAAVWRGWGIEPDAVVGHSMGEVAAAHIAGILDLQDAVAVICRRSRLMKTLRSAGSMATVELPLREVETILESRDGVSLGASNGPHTTVISGDSRVIEELLREFAAREIYCRQIKVDVASHSAQVDPILDGLFDELTGIRPQPAGIPMLSTVTGEYAASAKNGAVIDAAYWIENLRRAVLFSPAVQRLAADGHDTFIELSPHPILLPSTEASVREIDPNALVVATLRREKPARATMAAGLAALYAAGRSIDWTRLYSGDARCVRLPLYPFQRERHWPEPADPSRTAGAHWDGSNSLLGRKFDSSLQPDTLLWESNLSIAGCPWLNDHRVLRSAVFPASGHIDMALRAARAAQPDGRFAIRNASFQSAAYIPDQGSKAFQIALTAEGDGAFHYEIHSRGDEGEPPWPLRSRGRLQRIGPDASVPAAVSIADLQNQLPVRRDSADHYARAAKSGLQYGPAFQLVQEAWVGDGESLCRLQNRGQQEAHSVVHPTVLDNCFQAIVHTMPQHQAFQIRDTYLPVRIDEIHVHDAIPDSGDLFVHARLANADPEQGTFRSDLELLTEDGSVLLQVSGVELQRVARENLTDILDPLYQLDWVNEKSLTARPQNLQTSALLPRNATAENWLIFADASGLANELRTSLRFAGGRCTLVRAGSSFRQLAEAEFEIDPGSRRDLDRIFEIFSNGTDVPTAVVHMWSLDEKPIQAYRSEDLMRAQSVGSRYVPWVVQAITAANWAIPPRLWLVTAGAMTVDKGDSLPRIENAPMWGIGRTVAREHPELRPVLVDLSSNSDPKEARALALNICASGKQDWIALRGEEKYVARIARFRPPTSEAAARKLRDGEDYRIEITTPGSIDNIQLQQTQKPAPGPGEIHVQIVDAGLNFNDVLKVMGLYPGLIPGEPVPLGNEGAGRVVAVGEGVTGFRVGDEVIAITPSMRTTGLMATSVTVPADLAMHKPARLSMEQAATVAIVYLTAYWSLVEQARIRKGDWVLIHAGAGGVGLAAVEIAKWAGANIIATVGSEQKAEYLRSLGIAHILNSRSLDFAAGVMEITAGRGVDIVLNSLAGEFLAKSLEVLAPYGRFVEMGKRDIYEDRPVGLKVFRNNISFHVVDVAAAVEDRRPYVAELLREVMRQIDSGAWKPLPVQAFSSAEPAEAFRFMAQARHIGKIAIHMESDVRVVPAKEPMFSRAATYLITGGLGGIALTVAEWMAKNGAGHLVLLSRRAPSQESAEAIRRIEACGATVTSIRSDITRKADLAAALERIRTTLPPLKGIMHTAAVIDDALIVDLSPERFLPTLEPKIAGTWNLHEATLDQNLDFFVLFSSIAAVHPQPGMGSYSAANAFLDAFAHYRRALGKPVISVNWCGWSQIGLARAAGTGRSIDGYNQQGMELYSGEEALDALRRALESKPVQVIAVPVYWDKFLEFHGVDNIPSVFSDMVAGFRSAAAAQSDRSEILDQLIAAASPTDRREILEAYLQESLGRVLKLATHRIDRERPFGSMGLDSLMGLEFVRRLSNSLQIAVPATAVFNYPTIKLLAAHLLGRMQLNPVDVPADISPNQVQDNGIQPEPGTELPEMSEEEALQALISEAPRKS